jgi:hypothetical protein
VTCRARYQRHLLLAQLDPKAEPAYARLGQGVGLVPRPWSATAMVPVMAALAIVLCAGVAARGLPAPLLGELPGAERANTPVARRASPGHALASAVLPGRPPSAAEPAATESFDEAAAPMGTEAFAARGEGPTSAPEALRVFRVRPGAQPQAVSSRIGRADELAFAYRNTAGKRYVMVYGIDSEGAVHWYHPAWTDPADAPRAVRASAAQGWTELPEAVRHPLEGERLSLHLLLLDAPLRVTDVEALQEGLEPNARLPIDGAVQETFEVELR